MTDIAFRDKACGGNESNDNPVQVVPLLVNDNIDVSTAAVGRRQLRALGLALQGLRGNVGLGLDASSRNEQLLRALGSEFNPVLTIGQTPGNNTRNSIRVRVGAVEKGVDKHELVSRSYMVTALLLVPDTCVPKDPNKNTESAAPTVFDASRLAADVEFTATTTFRHARNGVSAIADRGEYRTTTDCERPQPLLSGRHVAASIKGATAGTAARRRYRHSGTRGHTRHDRSSVMTIPAGYGHGMSTDRAQAASCGHDSRDDPTVGTCADSWVEVPMVSQKAPEGDSGHRAQRSLCCPAESARARPWHKMGTGWAQSKKPPGWVASASQLTR